MVNYSGIHNYFLWPSGSQWLTVYINSFKDCAGVYKNKKKFFIYNINLSASDWCS